MKGEELIAIAILVAIGGWDFGKARETMREIMQEGV